LEFGSLARNSVQLFKDESSIDTNIRDSSMHFKRFLSCQIKILKKLIFFPQLPIDDCLTKHERRAVNIRLQLFFHCMSQFAMPLLPKLPRLKQVSTTIDGFYH